MLIIIEGPDGAGKTELLGQLRAQYRACDRLVSAEHLTYKSRMPDYLKLLGSSALVDVKILDRAWYSESIYAKALNRFEQLDESDYSRLEKLATEYNALLILCDAADDVLIQRAFTRGEDYVDKVQLTKVAAGYRRMFNTKQITMANGTTIPIQVPMIQVRTDLNGMP